MASARAMLTEVLTPQAYDHVDRLRERLVHGIEAVVAEHQLSWHVITAGAKGCIAFGADPIRNYRDFLATDDRYGHAHWLLQHNGGVFLPPWGKVEQWLISVQHTDVEVDLFVQNVRRLAHRLSSAAA
jgi:glutamate-1-semialdehyde 2,1-aminomutase